MKVKGDLKNKTHLIIVKDLNLNAYKVVFYSIAKSKAGLTEIRLWDLSKSKKPTNSFVVKFWGSF